MLCCKYDNNKSIVRESQQRNTAISNYENNQIVDNHTNQSRLSNKTDTYHEVDLSQHQPRQQTIEAEEFLRLGLQNFIGRQNENPSRGEEGDNGGQRNQSVGVIGGMHLSAINSNTIRKVQYIAELENILVSYYSNKSWNDINLPDFINNPNLEKNDNGFFVLRFSAFGFHYVLMALQSNTYQFGSLNAETLQHKELNPILGITIPSHQNSPIFGYFIAEIQNPNTQSIPYKE